MEKVKIWERSGFGLNDDSEEERCYDDALEIAKEKSNESIERGCSSVEITTDTEDSVRDKTCYLSWSIALFTKG